MLIHAVNDGMVSLSPPAMMMREPLVDQIETADARRDDGVGIEYRGPPRSAENHRQSGKRPGFIGEREPALAVPGQRIRRNRGDERVLQQYENRGADHDRGRSPRSAD